MNWLLGIRDAITTMVTRLYVRSDVQKPRYGLKLILVVTSATIC